MNRAEATSAQQDRAIQPAITAKGAVMSTDVQKPAAATVLAMSFLLLSLVMEAMPFFEEWKELALTHHFRAWVLVFTKPMQLAQMAEALCVLAAVNVTAFIIGTTHFHMRDIKS